MINIQNEDFACFVYQVMRSNLIENGTLKCVQTGEAVLEHTGINLFTALFLVTSIYVSEQNVNEKSRRNFQFSVTVANSRKN